MLTYAGELTDNFMDNKGHDVSPVLRGRLYQLKDIIGLVKEIDTFDGMKTELLNLENEGYKATPDEGFPN